MASGETTARSLAEHYLERTEQIDKQGLTLNAVIEINPIVHLHYRWADDLDVHAEPRLM